MTGAVVDGLQRENLYLRTRNAQLQSDVDSLSGENQRLREERERLYGRMSDRRPDPLGGGQGA
ncbi:MAG TPA: hypothetical protein VFW47_07130 [Phenylobacterium sp.]|nr:hypothetical protein [Phenylobacterium sp.]